MAKEKYTFPGPLCPGCQYHQLVGCTRYCSGFPKKRKPRRFNKSDPKYKPPKWCPRRISPPVCRVYGFVNSEAAVTDWLLNREATAAKSGNEQDVYRSDSEHHYKLRLELPLGLTAKQFYEAMEYEASTCVSTCAVSEIRNQVEYGEVIEIDDGLKPYYFYYTTVRVIPLAHFDRSRVQPSAPAPVIDGSGQK